MPFSLQLHPSMMTLTPGTILWNGCRGFFVRQQSASLHAVYLTKSQPFVFSMTVSQLGHNIAYKEIRKIIENAHEGKGNRHDSPFSIASYSTNYKTSN